MLDDIGLFRRESSQFGANLADLGEFGRRARYNHNLLGNCRPVLEAWGWRATYLSAVRVSNPVNYKFASTKY